MNTQKRTQSSAQNITSESLTRRKSPSPPAGWLTQQNALTQTPQPAEKTEQLKPSEPISPDNATCENATEAASVCEPQEIPVDDKLLSVWRGSLTVFDGFTGTQPASELADVPWEVIRGFLCPGKPEILTDKRYGRYIVPCLLKEAPLVGNTLETAKLKRAPTVGKMRSKDHVTAASFLIADIDGLSEEEFNRSFGALKEEGITIAAYTTFSHGSPEKPGMRVRLFVPFDRQLTADDYSAAWRGFDQKYFGGRLYKADPSGAKLYQQQGTWNCHPTRIRMARSWAHNGCVATAEELIKLGRTVMPPTISTSSDTSQESKAPSSGTHSRIIALLEWADPDLGYPDWFRVLCVIFYETKGSHEGLEIADSWSSGGRKYRGAQDVYKRWKSFDPDHPRPVKIGTLVRYAQEAGADVAAIMHDDAFEVCEDEEDEPDESDLAPETSPVQTNPLATIQVKFGLLSIGSKISIFNRGALAARTTQHTAKKLVLHNRSDGALLIERALRADYPRLDASETVKEFFVSPETVCYAGVEFNPRGTTDSYLNLWEGPTVVSEEGSWSLIQVFLYDIICAGDWDSYLYLIHYLAHALHRPEEKPGVMIILIGGQGIGKGTVGRILQRIWSATYIQVNNIDAVIGTFNAVLERAYIVFMDEALFAGNRRGTDELKSTVTEPIIQISEKYQPSRQIRSHHRFIAATNADHFKNTERDDRRDFTLRVSDARKGDLAYWTTLNDEIENGGVEAMVYDLLQMDLSDFNVRNKPNTKELVEQKIHSLDPIQRWWHDKLYCGGDEWDEFLGTSEAIEGIVEVNGVRIHKRPSAITVSQALQKMCPGAKSHQKNYQGGRHRGYLLPTLQQGREEFEQYIGGVLDWPEEQPVDSSAPSKPRVHPEWRIPEVGEPSGPPLAPLGSDSDGRAEEPY